jgi:hypothetical protein
MTNTGSTSFLVAMIRTPKDKLAKADPEKLARKYGVPADWVRMSLAHWLGKPL